MKDGRRTTFKERKKIVYYCLKRDKNYWLTCMVFDVSYNQIYSWVRKYEQGGYDALKDGRGRPSPESKMTPEQLERIHKRIRKVKRQKPRIDAAYIQRMSFVTSRADKKRSK